MDPRIGWHPTELLSNAYSTWTNVWMIAQMNCTTDTTPSPLSIDTKPAAGDNNDTANSYSKLINLIEVSSNPNLSVTSQTILNGLKSRKINKASTFGFNFPINQHILDDPMSTPWLFNDKYLEANKNQTHFLNSSSLLFLNNKKEIDTEPAQQESLNNLSTYSSYLINNERNRNRSKTSSSSSCASSYASSVTSTSSLSLSSSPPSQTNEDDSIINMSNLTSYDDELEQINSMTNQNFDFTSQNKQTYSEGLNSLHKEILLFADYIAPTLEELYMRNEIIWRITKVIKEELPQAEVDVFGSYKTGLFLPTSDIDMVVFGEWKHLPLKTLKDALIKEKISDEENIKVLDKATVPIIKILETRTDIKVDISFNTSNGVKSAELIKKYLVEFP